MPKHVDQASLRQYKKNHPDKVREYQRKYQKAHRQELHARWHAEQHIPLGKTCELCGSTEKLQRHHPDPKKLLEVQTVCLKCHHQIHYRPSFGSARI